MCPTRGIGASTHENRGKYFTDTSRTENTGVKTIKDKFFILISDKEIQDTYSYLLLYSIKSNIIILAE